MLGFQARGALVQARREYDQDNKILRRVKRHERDWGENQRPARQSTPEQSVSARVFPPKTQTGKSKKSLGEGGKRKTEPASQKGKWSQGSTCGWMTTFTILNPLLRPPPWRGDCGERSEVLEPRRVQRDPRSGWEKMMGCQWHRGIWTGGSLCWWWAAERIGRDEVEGRKKKICKILVRKEKEKRERAKNARKRSNLVRRWRKKWRLLPERTWLPEQDQITTSRCTLVCAYNYGLSRDGIEPNPPRRCCLSRERMIAYAFVGSAVIQKTKSDNSFFARSGGWNLLRDVDIYHAARWRKRKTQLPTGGIPVGPGSACIYLNLAASTYPHQHRHPWKILQNGSWGEAPSHLWAMQVAFSLLNPRIGPTRRAAFGFDRD